MAASSNGMRALHFVHSATGLLPLSVTILNELFPHFGQLICMARSPVLLQKHRGEFAGTGSRAVATLMSPRPRL
jgi:hypothetical protein